MVQIKSWENGEVLFEYEGTIKEAVEEAVRRGISLYCANLRRANLRRANLKGAYLRYANLSGAILQGADLRGANLRGANLRGANLQDICLRDADFSGAILQGANLQGADLRRADLKVANLRRANLEGANLNNANLRFAYLISADLSGANLEGADLENAYLISADLSGANLKGADLYGANLKFAKNIPNDFIPLACPAKGSFIAWKKVRGKLIKLEIPEDAKRSSATTHKCRCSKAKVLAITNLDETETFEEVFNGNYATLTYRVGKIVYPDSFDEDRWYECSHGIHFFMDKEDALNFIVPLHHQNNQNNTDNGTN